MFLPIVLTVCTLPQLSLAATCTGTTSAPSGYTLRQTYDVVGYGTTSACTSKTTKYYTNSTDKTYVSVTSCNSCSGTNVHTITHTLSNVTGTGCDIDAKYCSVCYSTTTKPSGFSSVGGPMPSTNGCSSTQTKYFVYETSGIYITVTNGCTGCKSGYHYVSHLTPMSGCPVTYGTCEACGPGTYYYQGKCKDCAAGTYSDSYEASSCTTCPDMDGVYTDAAHTKVASVANGRITSAAGATKNKCYLKSGTYYDSVGAFTHEGIVACYYDGTYEETPADKCTDITYACRASQFNMTATSQIGTGALPGGASGKYCFCHTNGKYFYMTSMGSSDTDASICQQSCLGACKSIITNNPTLRTNLGC